MHELGKKIGHRLEMLWDLMVLNFLFLLTSLPVITAGASLCALNYAAQQMLLGEGQPVKNYFTAWKRDWKQGTVLWLLIVALGFFCLLDLSWARAMPDPLGQVLLIPGGILFFALAMVSTTGCALLARFDNTLPRMLKNALAVGTKYLLTTLVVFLLGLVPAAMAAVLPQLFLRAGFLWLSLWYSLLSILYNRRLNGILQLKKPGPNGEIDRK